MNSNMQMRDDSFHDSPEEDELEYRAPYLTDWAQGILVALQSKVFYLGTADPKKVARNRRRNKEASKQRQVNRKNGSGR